VQTLVVPWMSVSRRGGEPLTRSNLNLPSFRSTAIGFPDARWIKSSTSVSPGRSETRMASFERLGLVCPRLQRGFGLDMLVRRSSWLPIHLTINAIRYVGIDGPSKQVRPLTYRCFEKAERVRRLQQRAMGARIWLVGVVKLSLETRRSGERMGAS